MSVFSILLSDEFAGNPTESVTQQRDESIGRYFVLRQPKQLGVEIVQFVLDIIIQQFCCNIVPVKRALVSLGRCRIERMCIIVGCDECIHFLQRVDQRTGTVRG